MSISPVGGFSAGPLETGSPVSGAGSFAGGGNEAKIRELEKKLANLTEEKKKAEQNHDAEKAEELAKEIEKVRKQLEQLKRKEKKEKEKQKTQEDRLPPKGAAGQYIDTWA